jgi:sugar lactone lactonase YvrE
MRGVTPELVCDANAICGEGPCWDADRSRLLWVDIDAGLLHAFDPVSGDNATRDVGSFVSAVIPRQAGGLVLARQGGVFALDEESGDLELLAPIDAADASLRTNDAKCDPAGRLWVGTMALDERIGVGSLFRLDAAGGQSRVMLTNVTISNGLGWSPDGGTMYYVDTPLGRIDAFDFDSAAGAISNRRTFVEVTPPGYPDGLCVDAEGCLWLSLWGGSAVNRYAPNGQLVDVIPMPVEQVTSCCFGGADLGDLYITTAARGHGGVNRPSPAGGLFRVRAEARGLPQALFAS